MSDVMIDLETFSTCPECIITTLGAVSFDLFEFDVREKLYIRLDTKEQEDLNRVKSKDTMDWWDTQTDEAKSEVFCTENRISINETLDQLDKFCQDARRIWSHGSIFDIVILENLYKQMNRFPRWKFWQIRDTRTIFDLDKEEYKPILIKHNALNDAIVQAQHVQKVYRNLVICGVM